MALFKISKGNASDLPSKSSSWGNGYAWFTQDDGKFYIDYYNGDDTQTPLDESKKIRQPLNAEYADKLGYSTVGSTAQPIYLNNGIPTAITGALGNDITGNAATATKATQDASGNVITSTYLPLSGGTMTGTLYLPSGNPVFAHAALQFTSGARIGQSTSSSSLCIYSPNTIVLRPGAITAAGTEGIEITTGGLYPTNNNTENLGLSDHKWADVYAVTFNGALSGTAEKATADGSGNNIVNTYLTKAAGVTNVAWDNTNKKLTKTINGSTSDIVAITVNNPTLAWNTESIIAKIGTVDIKVKLPENPNTNTDTLVKQTAKTDSVEYKILTTTSASPTSGNAAEAGYGANLAYNPSLNRLSTGNLKLTGELDVTGNASLRSATSIDSLTAGSLIVNGNSSFVNDVSFTKIPTAPTAAAGTNDTSLATTAFVKNSIASLSTAMHFIGKATVAITDGSATDPTVSGYDFVADRKPGDVIIDKDNAYEYVWTYEGKWERLGPDGSYKITQSRVDTGEAATNKWVSRIQQDTNGNITATMGTLDTSGTWSGNAATASAVTQNATTNDNYDYRILLSTTATDSAETGALNKDSTLRYNPNSNFLKFANASGGISSSTGTLTLNAYTTIYLNRGSKSSIVFQSDGSAQARFNPSGNFILGTPDYPENITEKLYVDGKVLFKIPDGTTSAKDIIIRGRTFNDVVSELVLADSAVQANNKNSAGFSTGNTLFLQFNQGGVYIGSSSLNPSAQLKVFGSIETTNALNVGGNLSVTGTSDAASSTTTTASIYTAGGIAVAKTVAAKSVKIDNSNNSSNVELQYDATLGVLNFVFS